MIRLEWLFLMQFAMGIVMIIFLQKLTQMKKQVDEVTREVMNYISFITKDVEAVEDIKATEDMGDELSKEADSIVKEEDQNRLIQAVLREYFP